MSWIVETFIINSKSIRGWLSVDSDEYLDLISIESAVEKLLYNGVLRPMEYNIVHLMSEGLTFKDISEFTGIGQRTVSKAFSRACNKIAYFLGYHFTDEGFLMEIKENHRLSEAEIAILAEYISGNQKHKLARKVKIHA